jgi:hypothetical protein
MQLPVDDKHNYSRDYLNDQIAILLGGRIAEEITIGSMTTGAGNDIERATELARKMVCEWGMSDAMGPLTFGKKEEQIFLGREIAQHQDYSEDTALRIDQEIKRFVTTTTTAPSTTGCGWSRMGADILDVGGESTRPGADPLPPTRSAAGAAGRRAARSDRGAVPLSIDTYKAVRRPRSRRPAARPSSTTSAGCSTIRRSARCRRDGRGSC